MWGKGVLEVVPFFVSFRMSILVAKVAKFDYFYGTFLIQFWLFFFFMSRSDLGAFWEFSWAS